MEQKTVNDQDTAVEPSPQTSQALSAETQVSAVPGAGQGSARKWGVIATWLLVLNIVTSWIRLIDAIMNADDLSFVLCAPVLISLHAVYKFHRWGFYLYVVSAVVSSALLISSLQSQPGDAGLATFEVLLDSLFGILVLGLIVRTRWRQMR